MKNVKLLIKAASILLESALKPSEFRPFIKEAVLKKQYKSYLDHIFKGKDRIYIPFKQSKQTVTPKAIVEVLDSKGYTIEDYEAGLAKNKNGRLIKIGKILSQEENSKELLDEFNTSRSNSKKKELQIVISRHPYDLAGMSTGRGWTSCMNLSKSNCRYIHKDIENGTLIAYIIEKSDNEAVEKQNRNIKRPICRLLLKQYISIKDEKSTVLYPEKTIYGEEVKGFRETIIKWLETFQDFKGLYSLNPKVYNDDNNEKEGYEDERPVIGDGDKYSDNYLEQLAYYEKYPKDKDAKTSPHYTIRQIYYKNYPKDKDAKFDEDYFIRKQYYYDYPKDTDAKFDEDFSIVRFYYKNYPNDTDAKTVDDRFVREYYYLLNPNDTDAKKDKDKEIRRRYYENNPNDNDTKFDEDPDIRYAYYSKNKKDKDAKYDEDDKIRELYYSINKNDKDAKKDKNADIRFWYYENNSKDKDAKFDEDLGIQKMYYENHKNDKDYLKNKELTNFKPKKMLNIRARNPRELAPRMNRRLLQI